MAQRRGHLVRPSSQPLETNGDRDKAMLGAQSSSLDSHPMGFCGSCKATTFVTQDNAGLSGLEAFLMLEQRMA